MNHYYHHKQHHVDDDPVVTIDLIAKVGGGLAMLYWVVTLFVLPVLERLQMISQALGQ